MLDHLEQRRLLAIPVSGGIATITGSGGNDVLEIVVSGGVLQLRNNAGTVVDSVSASGVTGVVVNAGSGNDFVRFGRADGTLMPNVNATIRGNPGNDTLIGTNRDDQIFGDIDNDKLDGRAGRDLLDGSSGFDTVDYGNRTVAVRVSLLNNAGGNDGSNTGDNSSPARYNDQGGDNVANMEAVVGGSAADRLVGNAAANWFDGGGGNDSIFGGAGIDTVIGGVNNDLAYGEGEDDYFFVQDSTGDQFLGGAGTTFANFDSGIDTPAPALPSSPTSRPAFLRNPPAGGSPAVSFGPRDDDELPLLELDTTFGQDSNGKVVTFVGKTLVQVNDVAVQVVSTDDEAVEEKIVVVGTATGPSGSDDFVLIRYNSDGSIDESFGPDESGIVFTDFGNIEVFSTDAANSLAIDDAGNIIVAGSARQSFSDGTVGFGDFAIARYLPNGILDDDFGGGGQVIINPDGLVSDATASRIAIQKVDLGEVIIDQYVVAGTIGPAFVIDSSASQDFGVVRLSSSGAFDESFGLVRADFGSEEETNDVATGLAIDPANNNIWVSGHTSPFEGSSDFAVAGFFEDGTPINGAEATLDFGGDDEAYDAAIDGTQLLVVGTSNDDGAESGAIATFDISVIPSLGPGTLLNSTLVTDSSELSVSLRGVAIDNNGRGVAVGTLGGTDFYVHRFNLADLSPFGDPVTVNFASEGDSFDQASAVAVQADGKLVVAGSSDGAAALARLQSEQLVDVPLSPQDVQDFVFTFLNDQNVEEPVPAFLVQRVKALKPDGTLEVPGTDLDDVITVTQSGSIITVDTNGDLFSVPASLVTRVVIHGLGGNDVIDTDDSLSVPLIFNGNEGNDLLRSGSQADQLNGGPGHDVLVARAGADLLLGEDGFDFLIGGLGSDTARGGTGDDILIGGFTVYDNDLPSLKLVIAEWSNPAHSYSVRFAQLQGPGVGIGLNGDTYLKGRQTVFDDNHADVVEGGAGRDWFFAKKRANDSVLDQANDEHLSNL
jgi:uncharacterized delta-60 repeat protein